MNKFTGDDIVKEARTWLYTPFYHTGRKKGRDRNNGDGVDCCGLIICVLREVMGFTYDKTDYSRVMPNGVMRAEVETWCDRVEGDLWKPGDVMLFSIAGAEQHIGFYTGNGKMLHSYQTANAVSEHDITPQWRKRIVDVFRVRGISPC